MPRELRPTAAWPTIQIEGAYELNDTLMNYQGSIYQMRPNGAEGDPEIDFEAHGFWEEWEELERPLPDGVDTLRCSQLSFVVDHPQATAWDWYYDDDFGVMSARACELLWPWLRTCFNRFATSVNQAPYYLMRGNGLYLDCLDRRNSVFETFKSGPVDIKHPRRLVFFRSQLGDPQVFRVPEYYALFATDSIRKAVEDAKLRGFEFVSSEALRGYQ